MRNTNPLSGRHDNAVIPLEGINIASPCNADWSLMQGDDRVRFCQSCAKNMCNLSAMTKIEAERLVTTTEGRLCIRDYQRSDGTVITSDCPLVFKVVRRPLQWLASSILALLALGCQSHIEENTGKSELSSISKPKLVGAGPRKLSLKTKLQAIANYGGFVWSGNYTVVAFMGERKSILSVEEEERESMSYDVACTLLEEKLWKSSK